MKETNVEFIAYLKKLKKEELLKIIEMYNKLAIIFNNDSYENKKASKDDLANFLEEHKYQYLKSLIMSLDLEDYEVLKMLINKNCDTEFLNAHKDFINYLITYKVLWQKNDLEITLDIKDVLKEIIKDKEVINYIKKWNYIYKLVDGIIIAYGVISKKDFDKIIGNIEEHEQIMPKLEIYYKKSYLIDKTKIVSNKLTNKSKINKYLKDVKLKEFKIKDFALLGTNNYHHDIKSYKKFIKMLKSNYVFKKKDILYVDVNIVIPYLYNSINEEQVALEKLEATIIDLFEFKGDKLKTKMLEEIKKIRDEFPLWEYRGFTKLEVNHE